MLGNMVGTIHVNSINRKCIVAQRFLRLRVEIKVGDLLPAEFFMDRADDNDIWKGLWIFVLSVAR